MNSLDQEWDAISPCERRAVRPDGETVGRESRAGQESVARTRLLDALAAITDVVMVMDRNGCYVEILPTSADNLCRPAAEMIGKKMRDVLPADKAAKYLDLIRSVLSSKQHIEADIDLDIRGVRRWFLNTLYPLDSDTVVLMAHDVTTRKKEEQSLRRFRAAIEASINGIAIAGTDGIIQFVNPAWVRMHGHEERALIGSHLSVFHTPEQMEREVRPFIQRVLDKGAASGEVGHLHQNGSIFPTWMQVGVVWNPETDSVELVSSAIDISNQKRLERERRQISAWERRRVGQYIHDGIAQEMMAATYRLGNFSKHFALSAPAKESVDKIALSLAACTERLRNCAAETHPDFLKRQNLSMAFKRVLKDLCSPRSVHYKITSSGELDGVPSDLGEQVYLFGREAITNALIHGRPRFVEVTILTHEKQLAEVTIRDDGCGFDPRRATGRDGCSGKGLGLFIMRHRAEAAGAVLSIESKKGGGTTVRCVWPENQQATEGAGSFSSP